jgi:hypothetical protein
MSLTDQDRQIYKDVTIEEAIKRGCDVVQLKYDGWWSYIVTKEGWRRFYSRTKREFRSTHLLDLDENTIMVGEHMQGTQWSQNAARLGRTYLFDIWQYGTHDLTLVDYRTRYNVLKLAAERLPDTFSLAPNYPSSLATSLWESHVEQNGFEGLIFRKSTDPVAAVVYRCKKIVTADLQAISFYEGQGKFAGTLGGINARTESDVLVDVGGGFSDDERNKIWQNQELYLNRWFEIEARAQFTSGSFRHPNFIRWREDKDRADETRPVPDSAGTGNAN